MSRFNFLMSFTTINLAIFRVKLTEHPSDWKVMKTQSRPMLQCSKFLKFRFVINLQIIWMIRLENALPTNEEQLWKQPPKLIRKFYFLSFNDDFLWLFYLLFRKTPKFGSKRAQLAMGLSPAAKNLLHHRLGIKVGSSGNSRVATPSPQNFGGSARSTTSSFAGTPDLRSFVKTSKQQRQYPATPEHSKTANKDAANAVSNLLELDLQLPSTRPKAVDFD